MTSAGRFLEDCYNYLVPKFRNTLFLLLVLWIAFVFSAFFIVQKPLALQVGSGLLSILKTLFITGLLFMDAACLGGGLIFAFFPEMDKGDGTLLGAGLGLGLLGFTGFGLAASGIAKPFILWIILSATLALSLWRGWVRQTFRGAQAAWKEISAKAEPGSRWIPIAAGITLLFSLVLAFAPPAESFDALAYHLAVPASWLSNGGLANNIILPSYWFPDLSEGIFVWGLALDGETVPQLIHFTWAVMTIVLLWSWTRKIGGASLAWRSTALIISIPSLPLVASWAYSDFTLVFFFVSALYLLWHYKSTGNKAILALGGVFCGLAMGVKYASFILPITAVIWLAWQSRRKFSNMVSSISTFSLPALLTASPWYIRNWIWSGNPIFPFIFGGKFWDAFRAANYSQPHTGIGTNLLKLFLIPLDVTMGHHDTTYWDGRIGPLWLVLLPVVVWTLWNLRKEKGNLSGSMYLLAAFSGASFVFWTIGIMNTAALWQSRYLFPGLMILSPAAANAWGRLERLDLKKIRLSFIFNILVGLIVTISLFDTGLFVLARNPLAAATGMESKQSYYERNQPAYADALALVQQTPPGAKVIFLYEPRTFGMSRTVQSDLVLDNLQHAFYLYHTPENVLHAWQEEGYSYVLFQHAGDGYIKGSANAEGLFSLLEVTSETSNTILYKIPIPQTSED